MGDFDYLDDVDVEKDNMYALENGEYSPDSLGKDVGEIAEEDAEIFAALLLIYNGNI